MKTTRHAVVTLSSAHLASMVRADDQAAAFRLFLTELLRRIGAAQPDATFMRDMPPAMAGANGVAVLGGIAMIALSVVMLPLLASGGFGARPVLSLGFALITLVSLTAMHFKTLSRNRPRSFDPAGTDWHEVWEDESPAPPRRLSEG
jgi:hypothetical protein